MIHIGIDPGGNTGFAVWSSSTREFLEIETLRIDEALFRVLHYVELMGASQVSVVFEDARQRKFFEKERSLSEYRGKLMGAGSVKRDSKIWEDFLKAHRIKYWAKPPQKGATKWEEAQFKAVIGWKDRTSEHARDAALLVWGM